LDARSLEDPVPLTAASQRSQGKTDGKGDPDRGHGVFADRVRYEGQISGEGIHPVHGATESLTRPPGELGGAGAGPVESPSPKPSGEVVVSV
jgi:hypothetical protein